MPYTILVRKINSPSQLRRDSQEITEWFLENYDCNYPDIGVCSVNLEMNDQPLLVVLSDLEANMGLKLVGNDGTNRFVLYNNRPKKISLQDC